MQGVEGARGVLTHSRCHPWVTTFRLKMKINNSSDFQIWQQVNMISPPPMMIQKYSTFSFTLLHPSLPADCCQCSSQTHTPASATGTSLDEDLASVCTAAALNGGTGKTPALSWSLVTAGGFSWETEEDLDLGGYE